eukprot:jgi/Orpsp1_1/1189362/evm.model.d7180000071444.1
MKEYNSNLVFADYAIYTIKDRINSTHTRDFDFYLSSNHIVSWSCNKYVSISSDDIAGVYISDEDIEKICAHAIKLSEIAKANANQGF